ncbi:hypothetical protein LRY60_05210 [Candidatus Woesebacteria bacterium]|nr:hypothetical protein [Candidatus Woesebacteria bacterium]
MKKHSDRYQGDQSTTKITSEESSDTSQISVLSKVHTRFTTAWQWLRSPRSKQWRQRFAVISLVLIITLGGAAVYITSFTNFDLRQWAWGGAGFSQEQLSRASLELDENISVGDPAVAELFTDLTYLYPDADVVSVTDDDFGITAVAFKAFNPELQQTFIFIRVENAPYIEGTLPKVWVTTNSGVNVEAGVGEYVIENGQLVGYFITTVEGESDFYDTLSLTLDTFLDQAEPSPAFFRANFADDDMEIEL